MCLVVADPAKERRSCASLCVRVGLYFIRRSSIMSKSTLENYVDHRESERRTCTDDTHASQALQVSDERIGDLILDLLRRATGPVGENDDLIFREIRSGDRFSSQWQSSSW